jgi:methylase of polypeptide subunit release factors
MVEHDALLALLRALDARGYDFVTPTPATHGRVIARPDRRLARTLRDVFGWSLPFEGIDPEILALMNAAGIVEETLAGLQSALRVSRLRDMLFLHSAYPTSSESAVFFGPDSYRFADFIEAEAGSAETVVDIGAGSGVGGLVAGRLMPGARIVLTDVNPLALALARVNAAFAGRPVETVEAEGLDGVEGGIALALANPPYMVDPVGRDYRDGGEDLGAALSVAWAQEAVGRLRPGGQLLLYSGSAIVDGHDGLKEALSRIDGTRLRYREIDPDVFGEELEKPAYSHVERIAAVGAVLQKL